MNLHRALTVNGGVHRSEAGTMLGASSRGARHRGNGDEVNPRTRIITPLQQIIEICYFLNILTRNYMFFIYIFLRGGIIRVLRLVFFDVHQR